MPARALGRPASQMAGINPAFGPEGDVVIGATVPRSNGTSDDLGPFGLSPASPLLKRKGTARLVAAGRREFPSSNTEFQLIVLNGGTFCKVKSGCNRGRPHDLHCIQHTRLVYHQHSHCGLRFRVPSTVTCRQASARSKRDSATVHHRTSLENAVGIARVAHSSRPRLPVAAAAATQAAAVSVPKLKSLPDSQRLRPLPQRQQLLPNSAPEPQPAAQPARRRPTSGVSEQARRRIAHQAKTTQVIPWQHCGTRNPRGLLQSVTHHPSKRPTTLRTRNHHATRSLFYEANLSRASSLTFTSPY